MHPKDVLSQTHQELLEALEGISVEDAENVYVTGHWTVRDIIGNIGAHEKVLENILSSEILPRSGALSLFQFIKMGEEQFNAYTYESKKFISYPELVSEYTSTNQHIKNMFPQITDKELFKKGLILWDKKKATIADYIDQSVERKKKYIQQIKKFKKDQARQKHNPSKKRDLSTTK